MDSRHPISLVIHVYMSHVYVGICTIVYMVSYKSYML